MSPKEAQNKFAGPTLRVNVRASFGWAQKQSKESMPTLLNLNSPRMFSRARPRPMVACKRLQDARIKYSKNKFQICHLSSKRCLPKQQNIDASRDLESLHKLSVTQVTKNRSTTWQQM
jgi:hypothetical protein